MLTPIESPSFQQKGDNADKARLVISVRGEWSTFEKTFFDVRIFNAKSLYIIILPAKNTTPAIQPAREGEEKPVYESSVTIGERSFAPLTLCLQQLEEWRLRPGVS